MDTNNIEERVAMHTDSSQPEEQSLQPFESSHAVTSPSSNGDDDPSSSTTQATKAIDMAEGDAWFPRTPSRPASLASASTNPYEADEQRSLFNTSPPPPNYAEATAFHERAFVNSVEEEEDLYSADRPIASFNPLQPAAKQSSWKKFMRRHWKAFCLTNLLIYCVIATGLAVSPIFPGKAEVILPMLRPEWVRDSLSRPDDFNNRPGHCLFDPYHGSTYTSIPDSTNFSLREALKPSDYRDFGNVSISGSVEIRPARYAQTDPIEFIVSYATTSGWEVDLPHLNWSPEDQLWQIRATPSRGREKKTELNRHTGLKRSAPPDSLCLDIWVGIFTNTPLDHFKIHTDNMHVSYGLPELP